MEIREISKNFFYSRCIIDCESIEDYISGFETFKQAVNDKDSEIYRKCYDKWYGLCLPVFVLNDLEIESIIFSGFKKVEKELGNVEFVDPIGGGVFYGPDKRIITPISRVDYILSDHTGKIATYGTSEDLSSWTEIAHSKIGDNINVVLDAPNNRRAKIIKIKNRSLTERLESKPKL